MRQSKMSWAAEAVREYDPGVCEQRLVTSGEGHGKTFETSEKQMALDCVWAERLSRLQGPCPQPGMETWGSRVVGIPSSHFLLTEADRGIPGLEWKIIPDDLKIV